MAGKKRTPAPPEWYVPEAYGSAEDLDAGDWLLNLTLRRWLHDGAQPQTSSAIRDDLSNEPRFWKTHHRIVTGPLLGQEPFSQISPEEVAGDHRKAVGTPKQLPV
jgi:hypothetical protein